MAKDFILAIIIQKVLWKLFFCLLLFSFLKCVKYGREYCALVLIIYNSYQWRFYMH